MSAKQIVATVIGLVIAGAFALVWNNSIDNKDSCTRLTVEVHIAQKDIEVLEGRMERLMERRP